MAQIYHEKQAAALCGVHALNTLLQGPYFSEVELAAIGQELDQMERAILMQGGMDTAELHKFMAEGSGNVAADGMFSIQVLSKALEVWSLQVQPLDSPECTAYKADPTTCPGIICNLQEHWFTIRKVGGSWWNLNSLFPAPQPLSEFYLAAFLDTLRDQGYSIFVVTGAFPASKPGSLEGSSGRWFTPDEAKALTAEAEHARKRGRATNAIEGALARAAGQGGTMQLRTRHDAAAAAGAGTSGAGPAGGFEDFGDDEDPELAAAIAASLADAGQGTSAAAGAPLGAAAPGLGPAAAGGGAGVGHMGAVVHGMEEDFGDDEDPELAAAIAASLADAQPEASQQAQPQQAPAPEPLEPEPEATSSGAVEVAFRLPGGGRCSRRFASSSPASQLYVYLAAEQGLPSGQAAIVAQFPRKEVPNCSSSLQELGIQDKTLLCVDRKA